MAFAAFGADVRLDGEDIEDPRLLAREFAQASGALQANASSPAS
jgi:hypothetical protein